MNNMKELLKKHWLEIVILASAIVTAWYTNTFDYFLLSFSIPVFIYYFSKIYGRKIAIKHTFFSNIIAYFQHHLFEGALALYVIYEIIPAQNKIFSVSTRKLLIATVFFYLSYKFGDYIETTSKTITSRKKDSIIASKIIKYTIVSIAFLISLKYLNAEEQVKNVIIGAGFLSIIIGLAAQSTISNAIAGLLLLIDKPFSVGDLIEIQGTLATVEDIRLISTYVKTIDRKYIRIPNSTIFSENIINYKKNKIITIMEDIGISYSSDIDKAKKVIFKVLDEEEMVLKNPEPFIEVKELADSSVVLNVWYTIPSEDFNKTKMRILTKIYESLKKNNIEIPFPQRVNWFADKLKVEITKNNE